MIFKKDNFDNILNNILGDDVSLVLDFDSTITHYSDIYGKELHSVNSLIRQSPHIFPISYINNSFINFQKFSPYESDLSISALDRNNHLDAWYRAQITNFIESEINYDMLRVLGSSNRLRIRKHVKETFELFQNRNLPIFIVSAGGVGKEMIPIFLHKNNISLDGIHIISNGFVWSETGKVVKAVDDIIHSYNKNEKLKKYINQIQVTQNIELEKKTAILIGDSVADPFILGDDDYNEILRIGFYNHDKHKNLHIFRERYDMVITNDKDFEEIYNIISSIFIK